MNIQVSVVIWTVICFLLLMQILGKLLFEPMLELMDKRRARIDAAQARKAEVERLTAEHGQRLELLKEQAQKNAEAEHRAQLEHARAENKKAIEQARAKRLEDVEEFRGYANMRFEQTLRELEDEIDGLASELAERLVKR